MNTLKPSLMCISGPTASGKTEWAERLAKQNQKELASADAFAFYKEIPILSNQPIDSHFKWHL